ncbi:ATP-binding cassette domain-containing protein [Moraxella sp. ZY210820]|uniref:ATP-binding cassette domain-containing protein n=1 Tax=unclassified Moraxella TaxID=2685852 RepID=UPI00272FABDC|nr:ATP-binding cassette domain-containing protein [Moraxella sp. ZY210820]WLF84286.1 peptidase domain-containing ABC transporter [Moraxella sp. ZY210820]
MNTLAFPHSSSAFFELQQAIFYCLRHYDYVIDRVAIQHILQQSLAPLFKQEHIQIGQVQSQIIQCLTALNISQVNILSQLEATHLPLIAHVPHLGWGVITQSITEQQYQFQQSQHTYQLDSSNFDVLISIKANDLIVTSSHQTSFSQFIRQQLISYRGVMGEAIIATFVINAFALAISLFSMQVYDRVIPTRNENTLIILASGVALVILLELVLKVARSKLMDKVMIGLDVKLSEHIYQRLLGIRLDLLPTSVGSMAAQLRGYEQIRSFYTSSTLFNLVDLPMGILFIVLIAMIGSVWVAAVPFIAGVIAVILGLTFRHFMDKVAKQGATYSYLKTGLLVETVEGMETIKSGFGQYKFLTKWTNIIHKNLKQDIEMKHLNDYLNYIVQTLQQLSYIGIVIVGSYVVMDGKMTMGAMIACSILGGRILNPIMQIPNLLVQSSHARVAKQNLDQLFQLKQDNDSQLKPLMPSQLLGHYQLKQIKYFYQQQQHPVLDIEHLNIKAGERIAILGAIGSGKSTLLKLLSGLYIAQQGQTLLDGLDIQQIHARLLQQKLGYLQQDHRLFQGTLRDNLLIGLAQPSDDELHHVLTRTGLMDFIQHHPKGLDLDIYEGGKGLSGGQKQLLAFSRLILTRPQILLLDEPTSSMDNRQEQRCIQLLNDELKRNQTVIISTHKMSILPLVNRIIVMERGKIIMDGSKQAVLDYFQGKRS